MKKGGVEAFEEKIKEEERKEEEQKREEQERRQSISSKTRNRLSKVLERKRVEASNRFSTGSTRK